LHEIVSNLCWVAKTSQFAGPDSAIQRQVDFREMDRFETKTKGQRVVLTAWEIGKAYVLARKAPRGLAVPRDRNSGKDTAHGLVPLAAFPAYPTAETHSRMPRQASSFAFAGDAMQWLL
jgi:hypothetical protein